MGLPRFSGNADRTGVDNPRASNSSNTHLIVCTQPSARPALFDAYSYPPPYFHGQVDVPEREMTVPNQAVKGALADHDLVSVMDADVVDRLLLPDERVAHTAVLAELVSLSGTAGPAEVRLGDRTGIAVDAGVVGDPAATGLFADTVVPYFERNGRRMLVKRPRDV